MMTAAEIDSHPPHDALAEQAVLGALLLNSSVLPEVLAIAPVQAFYLPKHAAILSAIISLHESGTPADPVMVAGELERSGDLARVGGAPYLHTLIATVPTVASAPHYAKLVREKHVARQRLALASRIEQYALIADGEPEEQEERLRGLVDDYTTQVRFTEARSTAIGDHLDSWLDKRLNGEPPAALTTGLSDLDRITDMRPGELIVIGARPSIGKTLLGLRLARHAARNGHSALVMALEMSRDELMDRVVSAECRIRHDSIRAHELTKDDQDRLVRRWDQLKSMPLYIEDPSEATMSEIKGLAREYHRRHQIELLVIDYLGLVTPDAGGADATRERQVAEMSRAAKQLAKELGIVVVLVHQVNRNPSNRSDPTPQLSDLRESGAIEADANQVWLLHRPEFSASEDEKARAENHPGEVQIIVAKNRGGQTGATWCAFQGCYQDIRDLG